MSILCTIWYMVHDHGHRIPHPLETMQQQPPSNFPTAPTDTSLTNQDEMNDFFMKAIAALRSPTSGIWNMAYGGSAPAGNGMSLGLSWPGGNMLPNSNSALYTQYPMAPSAGGYWPH